MKISYNWLRAYLNVDLSPFEMSAILTDIGLEVEGMESFQSVKGGLEGVIVGEVLACEKHPDADKLSVAKVDLGVGEPVQIVCGAPNVAEGQKVPVATVGATLYSGDEAFKIKKTKLRGVESEGMICAEDEIGLGDSHEGIMVLDKHIKPGTRLSDHYNIESDTVFEIGLTPNRVDSASHFGVARDLAAFLKQEKDVHVSLPPLDDFDVDNHDLEMKVVVENQEACPRYSGLTIMDLTIDESPEWLKNRLRAIGLNPINNVVDITNFILHDLGQPLHAFDVDKVKGDQIIVKTLPAKTKFTTLDEEERELASDDLMICDEQGGMCIGGVFGGLHSGVTGQTTRIFLESAYFNPVYIRKTAKRHGLSTDASFRFERGTDPEMPVYALKKAAMMMKEIAGGKISSSVQDVYPNPVKPFHVDFNLKNAARLIGKDIGDQKVMNILKGLDINVLDREGDNLKLEVPAYRVDVQREADVVEEVLRIYGYNNVEISNKLNSSIVLHRKPDVHQLRNVISDMLVSRGFNEVMNNSLSKEVYYEWTGEMEQVVRLFNPLSSDLNVYRNTLLFGLLENIVYNVNRQRNNLMLFEFGNVYSLGKDTDNPLDKYKENEHLSMVLFGNKNEQTWNQPEEPATFYQLKAYVENILTRLGMSPDLLTTNEIDHPVYAKGISWSKKKDVYAEMGIVDHEMLSHFNIEGEVFYANINWAVLLQAVSPGKAKYTELPKFPEVRRDLALLIDKQVQFHDIKDIAEKKENKLLKDVALFDVYESDEKLGKDKKSYAVKFIFQDPTKTLTDKQVDKIMNQLIKAYQEKLSAQIR